MSLLGMFASKGAAKAKITVVIPLYNHSRYIRSTLDSVLQQTSPADEIILIDDGSSDDGYEVAKNKLRGVTNARLFQQKNKGAHVALNTAIGMAQGEYIAVLNSDDLFHAKKLERCRKLIEQKPDTLMVAGRIAIIDENGDAVTSGPTIDWLDRAEKFYRSTSLRELSLLNENYICTTSNMLFRRDLWLQVGGFQALRYCHDLDFILAAYRSGPVIFDEETKHIYYRVHTGNTIKENLSKVRVEIAAVLAHALFESGTNLILKENGEPDVSAFIDFLRNKELSSLMCYFLASSRLFPSRQDFYGHATAPDLHQVFSSLV